MANCTSHTYTGMTAHADAATFLATLDDTKFLGICSTVDAAGIPTIIIVHKA